MARRICSHYPFVGKRICPGALRFPPAYRGSILAPSGNSHPSRTDRSPLALESDMQILTPIIFQYLSVKLGHPFAWDRLSKGVPRKAVREILLKVVRNNGN